LALGLIAALVVWGVIQRVHPIYTMPRELYLGMGDPAWKVLEHRAEQRHIDCRHAMIYAASLGALLALALGIGEGVARRSALPMACLLPLGLAGGALGGFLASLVQDWTRANVGLAEIRHTVAMQLALCLPLAAGIGWGLGLATQTHGGFLKTLLAGLAAGVLAAVVYPLFTSTLLPGVSTDSILPDHAGGRLLWLGLMAGIIGLVTPIAGRGRKRSSSPPAKAADKPAA
jgi:hypothetical protein